MLQNHQPCTMWSIGPHIAMPEIFLSENRGSDLRVIGNELLCPDRRKSYLERGGRLWASAERERRWKRRRGGGGGEPPTPVIFPWPLTWKHIIQIVIKEEKEKIWLLYLAFFSTCLIFFLITLIYVYSLKWIWSGDFV